MEQHIGKYIDNIPVKEVELDVAQKVKHRVSSQWMAEEFLSIFSNTKYQELEPQAIELVRRRQVMDLFVSPGGISAKIQESQSAFRKVSISMQEISDAVWSKAFREISRSAFYLGKLYSSEIPVEINEVFKSCGESLFLSDASKLEIHYCSNVVQDVNLYVAAVLYKFSVLLSEEPFALLLLRGKGRDEIILTLRALRRELSFENLCVQEETTKVVAESSPINWSKNPADFWRSSDVIKSLQYTIKADELPAALLKWLDPLPLNGMEDQIELSLEEAYAHVAKRAQAYGLGL